MSKRPGVMLYFEIRDAVDELSDAETAKLFRSILNYAQFGEVPDFSGEDRVLRIIWANVQRSIDRDTERYEATCEARAAAGAKGGKAKAANAKVKAEEEALRLDEILEQEPTKGKSANEQHTEYLKHLYSKLEKMSKEKFDQIWGTLPETDKNILVQIQKKGHISEN